MDRFLQCSPRGNQHTIGTSVPQPRPIGSLYLLINTPYSVSWVTRRSGGRRRGSAREIYGNDSQMATNKHVAYQAIGPVKGQATGRMMGLAVAVVIFVAMVAGLRHISGTLGTQPVQVAQTTAAQGTVAMTPTVFTPPDAKYDKVDIKDLALRMSSYTVRRVARRSHITPRLTD